MDGVVLSLSVGIAAASGAGAGMILLKIPQGLSCQMEKLRTAAKLTHIR